MKFNQEIFDYFDAEVDKDAAVEVIWWLVHLLGGQVTISQSDGFWEDNFPENAVLKMYKENDQLILAAGRFGDTETEV